MLSTIIARGWVKLFFEEFWASSLKCHIRVFLLIQSVLLSSTTMQLSRFSLRRLVVVPLALWLFLIVYLSPAFLYQLKTCLHATDIHISISIDIDILVAVALDEARRQRGLTCWSVWSSPFTFRSPSSPRGGSTVKTLKTTAKDLKYWFVF